MPDQPQAGWVIIPDISGFTEFLSEVEFAHGQHITAELLEALIQATELPVELSEIEGDGLLYYRLGQPPTLAELTGQMRRWFRAFHGHLARLRADVFCTCGVCQNLGNLRLKAVATHGQLARQTVGQRPMLMGRANILAHRLLKNTVPSHEYLLVTRELLEQAADVPHGEEPPAPGFTAHEDTYPVFGCQPLAWLDLAPWHADLPAPGGRDAVPSMRREFSAEAEVQAPLARAVAVLSNPNRLPDWADGIRALRIDPTEPVRAGLHHVCVFDDLQMHQTVADVDTGAERFRIAIRIRVPRLMLREMVHHYVAERVGPGRVRVRFVIGYDPRPVTGVMFEKLMRPRLERLIAGSVGNLKELLEGRRPRRTERTAGDEEGTAPGAPPAPAAAGRAV